MEGSAGQLLAELGIARPVPPPDDVVDGEVGTIGEGASEFGRQLVDRVGTNDPDQIARTVRSSGSQLGDFSGRRRRSPR
ncbi:MAG: hypothetical protein R2710_15550 [Acidimicrobiales bacterium]